MDSLPALQVSEATMADATAARERALRELGKIIYNLIKETHEMVFKSGVDQSVNKDQRVEMPKYFSVLFNSLRYQALHYAKEEARRDGAVIESATDDADVRHVSTIIYTPKRSTSTEDAQALTVTVDTLADTPVDDDNGSDNQLQVSAPGTVAASVRLTLAYKGIASPKDFMASGKDSVLSAMQYFQQRSLGGPVVKNPPDVQDETTQGDFSSDVFMQGNIQVVGSEARSDYFDSFVDRHANDEASSGFSFTLKDKYTADNDAESGSSAQFSQDGDHEAPNTATDSAEQGDTFSRVSGRFHDDAGQYTAHGNSLVPAEPEYSVTDYSSDSFHSPPEAKTSPEQEERAASTPTQSEPRLGSSTEFMANFNVLRASLQDLGTPAFRKNLGQGQGQN